MHIVKCFTSKLCQTIIQGISEFVKDNNKQKSKRLQIRAYYEQSFLCSYICIHSNWKENNRETSQKNRPEKYIST